MRRQLQHMLHLPHRTENLVHIHLLNDCVLCHIVGQIGLGLTDNAISAASEIGEGLCLQLPLGMGQRPTPPRYRESCVRTKVPEEQVTKFMGHCTELHVRVMVLVEPHEILARQLIILIPPDFFTSPMRMQPFRWLSDHLNGASQTVAGINIRMPDSLALKQYQEALHPLRSNLTGSLKETDICRERVPLGIQHIVHKRHRPKGPKYEQWTRITLGRSIEALPPVKGRSRITQARLLYLQEHGIKGREIPQIYDKIQQLQIIFAAMIKARILQ